MEHGMIFNIQPFSVYDGPGIRTTVFFKGCNLRCAWCHNPESWRSVPEIQFQPEKCIGCGACLTACPVGAHILKDGVHILERSTCQGCGACVENCFAGALIRTGQEMSVADVMTRIEADRAYYEKSGGGVTFSGGEAMLQIDFLEALLKECRARGIHTAVDTAGAVRREAFDRVLPYTDLFLYDIKAADAALHEKLTGADNKRILENLKYLCEQGARVIVRIPCVPGGNWEDLHKIAALLSAYTGIERVELLAYHRLGEGKKAALGEKADAVFTVPQEASMRAMESYFQAQGVPAVYKK